MSCGKARLCFGNPPKCVAECFSAISSLEVMRNPICYFRVLPSGTQWCWSFSIPMARYLVGLSEQEALDNVVSQMQTYYLRGQRFRTCTAVKLEVPHGRKE